MRDKVDVRQIVIQRFERNCEKPFDLKGNKIIKYYYHHSYKKGNVITYVTFLERINPANKPPDWN